MTHYTSTRATRAQAVSEAGVGQPAAKPTPEELSRLKQGAEAQIDKFMVKVGYTNPSDQTDEQGRRHFGMGSAHGGAAIVEWEGELFLHVQAPVMPLPSDKELILPLMREALELNAIIPGSARLGIRDEHIWVALIRPAMELSSEAFGQSIHSAMVLADKLDDALQEKYGGTSRKRAETTSTQKGAPRSSRRKKG